MKKSLIILFALIFTSSIFSQLKPQYGIKLGVNLPNITASSDKRISINSSNKYGITAGAFLELPLTKTIGITSEMFYEQISTENVVTFNSGGVPYYSENINVRSDYLSYLLKGKLNFLSGSVSPYAALGGKLSIFLDDKLSGSSQNMSKTVEIIVNENFRSLSFYPVISAGCEFKTSSIAVFLTEVNFSFPVESFFEYQQYGVSAKPYAVDLKIGLKF